MKAFNYIDKEMDSVIINNFNSGHGLRRLFNWVVKKCPYIGESIIMIHICRILNYPFSKPKVLKCLKSCDEHFCRLEKAVVLSQCLNPL